VKCEIFLKIVSVFMLVICIWMMLSKIYSTDVKFSQHAIFHIPGAAFRNNVAAGPSLLA